MINLNPALLVFLQILLACLAVLARADELVEDSSDPFEENQGFFAQPKEDEHGFFGREVISFRSGRSEDFKETNSDTAASSYIVVISNHLLILCYYV